MPAAPAIGASPRNHWNARPTGAGVQVPAVAVRTDPTRAVPVTTGTGAAVKVDGTGAGTVTAANATLLAASTLPAASTARYHTVVAPEPAMTGEPYELQVEPSVENCTVATPEVASVAESVTLRAAESATAVDTGATES